MGFSFAGAPSYGIQASIYPRPPTFGYTDIVSTNSCDFLVSSLPPTPVALSQPQYSIPDVRHFHTCAPPPLHRYLLQVYKTPNGVTCIGYTDMTSRLANTASTLFSNNVVKLFSSAGPFSTG